MHGLQVCVEAILYYHSVYTSDFFIDNSLTFNRTLVLYRVFFVNIVQENQGVFVHIRDNVAQGYTEEYFCLNSSS